MSTPAGWYPQPDGQQRYWDGEHWTDVPLVGLGTAVITTRKTKQQQITQGAYLMLWGVLVAVVGFAFALIGYVTTTVPPLLGDIGLVVGLVVVLIGLVKLISGAGGGRTRE